jgi:hypothetical protein
LKYRGRPIAPLGADAESDDEIVRRGLRLSSPRFSFQSRTSAGSSGLMMIRASDPPMNWRRSGFIEHETVRLLSLIFMKFFFVSSKSDGYDYKQ